jgi:hypothetical protein
MDLKIGQSHWLSLSLLNEFFFWGFRVSLMDILILHFLNQFFKFFTNEKQKKL